MSASRPWRRRSISSRLDWHTFHREQQAARGSDANPLSDSDLEAKLRLAASRWDSRYDAAPLIGAIWILEKAADVSKLISLTATAVG